MLWRQWCCAQLLIAWNKCPQWGKGKKGAETEEKNRQTKQAQAKFSYPVDVNLELRHYVKQMIESSESFNSEFLTFVLHVFL